MSDSLSMLCGLGNKREGPHTLTVTVTTCNGCRYLKQSMAVRSMRSNSDYHHCAHKSMLKAGRPKHIYTGKGSCPTPAWCPFVSKDKA